MPTSKAVRSIHYQQRWFYVLWVSLLLLSLALLALWERPLSLAPASLLVRVKVQGAPEGTLVQVWAGPWSQWRPDWAGAGTIQVALQPDGTASLPLFRIPIAKRRWVKGYIPRDTWDLMMLKFITPNGLPRYFALPLSMDIRFGVLRPRFRLMTTITTSWAGLTTDGQAPDQKP
jgi:hypothetical protein